MGIIGNILHPVKALEQKVLKDLIEKLASKLPIPISKIKLILERNKDEILEEVKKVIQQVVTNFICKKMEEQRNQGLVQSNN